MKTERLLTRFGMHVSVVIVRSKLILPRLVWSWTASVV
jgi:hypothetical protein